MMAQFLEIKADYPDALLFYRMGDFYELFFQDAVEASAALDIALTKRGKHLGEDIPMCGVPVHSAENYLLSLIRRGFRVAVCEQMEDPSEAKKRGSKSVVRREVVRLVTPGTLTEDTLLDARQNNFLCAYALVRSSGALAWFDISTGEFRVVDCPQEQLSPELARLAAKEVLLSEASKEEIEEIVVASGATVTNLSNTSFDSISAEKRLCHHFEIDSMDAFGHFERAKISAMGAILDYLSITQKEALPHIRPPVIERHDRIVQIDAATRRNLEISKTLSGDKSGSLIATIDRTLTPGGARLLFDRVSGPSTDIDELTFRLDAVDWLTRKMELANELRSTLRRVPDIDRALSRLILDRAGPRDMASIRDGIAQALTLAKILRTQTECGQRISEVATNLEHNQALQALLDDALVSEPPLLARDGGYISSGYSPNLDEYRALRDDGRKVIAAMQSDFATKTGISALKIKHNNVLGYFIETPATHAQKMLSEPLSDTFIHRQTTANAVRFTTVDLAELETKILNAGGAALSLEKEIFSKLRSEIIACSETINLTAYALAELDVVTSLADLAVAENWCRPHIDTSRTMTIENGRHPVVEAALKTQNGSEFVANDCNLTADGNDARIILLTGPNMAGKSTFLRQNAIIALLAQVGSFVPASSAHIGLISQLFSRVGASDDLARGRSTFMVEMVETAAILNQADDRALVILDEIGRGTATYDGLSIAWAVVENLHGVNRCRALFATHYHELTALGERLDGLSNATVSVKEWEGDVIFLHEVRNGAADRSYGVQVAKLAGLPAAVVERARVILGQLEDEDRKGHKSASALIDDLPLFSAKSTVQSGGTPAMSPVEDKLEGIFPDDLTPKDALQLLYDLKDLARGR